MKRVLCILALILLCLPWASVEAHRSLSPSPSVNSSSEICMARAIYHEARGESRLGQVAVGYTVMNRVASRHYPSTVCGVVYQKATVRGQTYCQFSWACQPEATLKAAVFAHSRAIAREVLARRVPNPIGKAVYFQVATIKRPPTKRAHYRKKLGNHAFYAYSPYINHHEPKKPMHQHPVSRDFFMKDILDLGYAAVKGLAPAYATNAMDLVRGYNLMDEAYTADGKPRPDFFIWTALARLQITAGDIAHAAVKVHVQSSEKYDELKEWSFGYQLDDVLRTFMVLTRVETPIEHAAPGGFPTKAVGPIDPTSYIAKLGSYPLQVHPRLAQRATAALNFMLIQHLTEAGILVAEHWIPENTAENFARYRLTDGQLTYHLDYYAPKLVEALKIIDAFGGRTEEDGALVDDPQVTKFTAAGSLEELRVTDLNPAVIVGTDPNVEIHGYKMVDGIRVFVGDDEPGDGQLPA